MRILIAEDDETLAKFVREGLEGENYRVDVYADGEQARSAGLEVDYDIVILDLNLPRLDGVTILRQLRIKKPSMPVLILTQRTKLEDRVQCLDTGADDYLPKPFSFSELSARIRALLRRSHLPSESVLTVADLKLDRTQRVVERAGKKVELTTKEFTLLEYLMQNAGRKVTRSMIIEHVWNLTFDTTTNVVDVYINYASAQVDQRKIGKLAVAIQEAFQDLGVFPGSDIRTKTAEPAALDALHEVQKLKQQAPTLPFLDESSKNQDLLVVEDELKKALASEIATHAVALHRQRSGLVLSLREFGFFDSGSAAIRPAAVPTLDRIASILAVRSCRLRIEGHTDNIPIHTVTMFSNWELSTARATELVRLLIVRYQFAPERLSAAGYAQYHPIASNETPEGRAQNRRVDIVILSEIALQPKAGFKPSRGVPLP
jgi:two-component system, OmpR family, copper resistance phosphate regulon response regulator CusR